MRKGYNSALGGRVPTRGQKGHRRAFAVFDLAEKRACRAVPRCSQGHVPHFVASDHAQRVHNRGFRSSHECLILSPTARPTSDFSDVHPAGQRSWWAFAGLVVLPHSNADVLPKGLGALALEADGAFGQLTLADRGNDDAVELDDHVAGVDVDLGPMTPIFPSSCSPRCPARRPAGSDRRGCTSACQPSLRRRPGRSTETAARSGRQ